MQNENGRTLVQNPLRISRRQQQSTKPRGRPRVACSPTSVTGPPYPKVWQRPGRSAPWQRSYSSAVFSPQGHAETSKPLCDMSCSPEELLRESFPDLSPPIPTSVSYPCSHGRPTRDMYEAVSCHPLEGDAHGALFFTSSSGHVGLRSSHHNHCDPTPHLPPFSGSRQLSSPPNLFPCGPSKPWAALSSGGKPFFFPSLPGRKHPPVTSSILSTLCLWKWSSLLQLLNVAFDT